MSDEQSNGVGNIALGAFFLIGGIALTVSDLGRLFYGAILFGGFKIIVGFIQMANYKSSKGSMSEAEVQELIDKIKAASAEGNESENLEANEVNEESISVEGDDPLDPWKEDDTKKS